MRRGDVVTMADKRGDYTSDPRPALVVQSDDFANLMSVTVCPITSMDVDAPLFRVPVKPSDTLALKHASFVEVDKITTLRRSRVRTQIGRIAPEEMAAVNRALFVFFGLAD